MLTRLLAWISFVTAVGWTLFASWLLVQSIVEEPQHAWLSIGLMSAALVPTISTALYVYRTNFGRDTPQS